MNPRMKRVAVGTAVVAALIGVGLGALWAFTPEPIRPRADEGRALLRLPDGPFVDEQLGLRFTPPPGWALQVVSVESPRVQRAERTVVKYKRVDGSTPGVWFKVSVLSDAEGRSPEELARTRKPAERGWKVFKDVELAVTVAGRPAARITFAGDLQPGGADHIAYQSEIVAVRRGSRALIFAGTFPTSDVAARQAVRAAVDSVVLEPD